MSFRWITITFDAFGLNIDKINRSQSIGNNKDIDYFIDIYVSIL